MTHPFPQLPPPKTSKPESSKPKTRSRALPLPALPWGEALIGLTIGLFLLQV